MHVGHLRAVLSYADANAGTGRRSVHTHTHPHTPPSIFRGSSVKMTAGLAQLAGTGTS